MSFRDEVLSTLFEGAPGFVERLTTEPRPESWTELLDRAEQIALSMPEETQIELLDSHPSIGADPTSVSAMSYREQGYDRDQGTAAIRARLDTLNEAYERRFGFRFVIFVNGRSRAEIAALMEQQMSVARDEEKQRALRDVIAIARDRLRRMAPAEEEER